MTKLKITAITEKGDKVLRSSGEDNKENKMARKLIGIKEEIICEDPLIIIATVKRIPKPLIPQIVNGLTLTFIEKGAEQNKDFIIEVLE